MEIKESLLTNEKDELSIKDIIKKIKMLFYFLKENLLRLILITMFGASIGFLWAYFSKPIYTAKVKFLMKESGGNGGLLNSLGSLGSLIGGAAGVTSPLDRTLAIIGSERVIGTVLLKPLVINQKKQLAISHFIDIYDLKNKWKKDTSLNGLKFELKDSTFETLSIKQRKAFRNIVGTFIGDKSTVFFRSFDKKSGVFDFSIVTINEYFSVEFSKRIYKEIDKLIYEQSISSSGKNVDILSNKLDSIRSALSGVQNQLARNTDRTLGLLMQEDKVQQKSLMIKEQMLTIMYGEAQKNLETFKFLNQSINSGLELLQYPYNPMVAERKSFILYSFILGFFTFIISFAILYFKHWFKHNL